MFVLITGAPPSPGRIMRSLLRHPLVTPAVIGMAAGLRPIGKMVRTGNVETTALTFARGVLGAEGFERLADEVRAHIVANGSALLATFRAGFEPISEEDIRSIKAPVLVVTGAQGPPFLRRVANLLSTFLPESRSLMVPSASHFMHLQNPSALNSGLLRFLTDVST